MNENKIKSSVRITLIAAACFFVFVLSASISFRMVGAELQAQSADPQISVPLADLDFLVTYGDGGFSPATLEIPLGSRVSFRNDSAGPLRVAADPYPSHSDYPEFSGPRDFAPGETYSFRFLRAGTFGFHNENILSDYGTIRVTDPAHLAADISKTPAGQQKQRDVLLALLVPNDPTSVYKAVDAIQADKPLSLNCHDIAHDLGHRAYELYGFSASLAFTDPARLDHDSVQDICAGGFVHGVLEEAALHQPDFKSDPGAMCTDVPAAGADSCYHGIGHALMLSYDRHVPASLVGCRSLGAFSLMTRCFEGVWMELFWGGKNLPGHDLLGWDSAQPLASCLAAAKDAKPSCFIYSAFGYLRFHPKDYKGTAALCSESSLSASDSEFCFKGLGITMISHFKGEHLELSEQFAEGQSAEDKRGFYEGVYGYAAFSGISKKELLDSCSLLEADGAICRSVVGE